MGEIRYSITSGAWPGEPHPDGEFFASAARKVEELGFHGFYAGDHLVIDNPIPESLTTVAAYAGATTKLHVGPMVLLLGLRALVPTAKQLAMLDVLSGGRLTLGVGIGGEFPHEWEACGVSTRSRGKRTDAYLDALRELLRGESVSRDNDFVSFEDVEIKPAAVQEGGPPIWIGGRSDKALERASRHDGWCAYAESARAFGAKTAKLRELVDGRNPDFRSAYMIFGHVGRTREEALAELTPILAERYGEYFTQYIDAFCAVGTPDDVRARIAEYEEGGATDILIYPQCRAADFEDQTTQFAELL